MPRPPIVDSDKKRSLVQFRLKPIEKVMLNKNALEMGLSVTDYIKLKTLDIAPKRKRANPEREILIKGLGELGRIGGNINQIARALNRGREFGQDISVEQVNLALSEIKNLSNRILDELANGD